jgi:hypothetical protein
MYRLSFIALLLFSLFIFSCSTNKENESNTTENNSSKSNTEELKLPKLTDTLEANGFKFYIQSLSQKEYTSLKAQPYLDKVEERKVTCPDKEKDYCPLEVEKVKILELNDSTLVIRKDKELKLRMKDSSYVTLTTDDAEETEYVGYFFEKYIEDLGLYLISVHYYEEREVLLVNAHNGEKLTTDYNMPVISPDRNRFISTAQIFGMGEPTAVSIFEIKDNSIKNILTYSKDWGAGEALWIDNNTIKIEQEAIFPGKNGGTEIQKRYCKLVILPIE